MPLTSRQNLLRFIITNGITRDLRPAAPEVAGCYILVLLEKAQPKFPSTRPLFPGPASPVPE